jgi:mRNA-degrading endonuclease RelE of RelBE toxin-antitoxin system
MDASAWTVAWTPGAQRSLRHIPPRMVPAVLSFVDERLAANPYRVTHALHEPLAGYRSASVGSYRVLIEANPASHTVAIVRVAYHADVYRA